MWIQLYFPETTKDFIEALRVPPNIRELGIHWENHLPMQDMLRVAQRWRQLHVLILHHDAAVDDCDAFQQQLCQLIANLKHLKYLSLLGQFGNSASLKFVLKDKIQSVRPSFRFYIGPYLPHVYYQYE